MTIISNEVDSPSTWVRPRKIVSAGTKSTPPPTPTRPPASPPAIAIRMAASSFTSTISSIATATRRSGEEQGDGALGDALLDRGAHHHPDDGGDREQEAGEDVHVAVDATLRDRSQQADQDDRRQAGAGGEPLAVAEPEDQQGHDHGAAADPEEAAEDAGQGADRGELEGRVAAAPGRRASCRDTKAVPPADETGDAAPGTRRWTVARRARRAAILTDVDGTLAPIVERPELAAVPARTSELLRALNRRYGLVGCISGRQALEARRLVGVEEIAYAGNHGLELLMPGEDEPQLDPALSGAERVAADFIAGLDAERAGGGRIPAGGQGPDPVAALARRRRRAGRRGPRPRDRRRGRAGRAGTALGPQGARAAPARRWWQGRRRGGAARRRRRSPPPSSPATIAPTSTPSAACASCARKASSRRCSASA